jgi:aminopeptidase
MKSLHRRSIEKGAHPQILFHSVFLEQDLMRYGSDEQLDRVPALQEFGMTWADACIDLRGGRNLYEFDGIAPDKLMRHKRSEGKISALRTEKTRWVIVRVPTEALAQQARKSTSAISEFFFDAVLLDWAEESKRYRRIRDRMEGVREVRIVGQGTDLRLGTEGRAYVVEDGHINMPGGEVFTSPVENTAEGFISFEHPGVYAGELIPGIRLEFEKGKVKKASAADKQDLLETILDMDEGSRFVGELGFGINPRVTFFSNDILYDEKIFGTVHIALGRSYKECGGKNYSALHWDIVKDLRQDGEIFADGKKIFRNGYFLD